MRNNMKEIWKDIQGYEGIYQASSYGRIKSIKKNKNLIMKLGIHRDGYYKIKLCKNGDKKWYQVHRLIAKTFLPNENNYPCVNHKDENKLNNHIDNLEWCTTLYNNTYGTRIERVRNKCSKPIIQYDLNNNFIKEYPSLSEAHRQTKIWGICKCVYGIYKQAGGYIWGYKEVVPHV